MATATDSIMQESQFPSDLSDVPHKFRGHPQPPINERLQNAKNFLADEDPNRDLNFATRISEVEEYTKLIEATPELLLVCDQTLLKDVKIMLKVHRDWEKRMDAPPEETEYSERPIIQPYSTRLLSTETKAQLVQDQAAMGLTYQTREDRAPFSVERQADHGQFLQALNEDAATNPMLIDEDTNLLFVESRAYSQALSDPAMIPTWMHPTRGIPKQGLKPDDPRLWYREPEPLSDAVKMRPFRGALPPYVYELEDDINSLLSRRNITDGEYEKLEELLRIFEPPSLAQLHETMDTLLFAESLGSLGSREEELVGVVEQFNHAHRAWLMAFRDIGVYLIPRNMIDSSGEVDLPGVFYVKATFTTPTHIANEDRANTILQKWLTGTMLNPTDTHLLHNLFALACPKEIRDLRRTRLELLYASGANHFEDVHGEYRTRCAALKVVADKLYNDWTAIIKKQLLRFIYLRPGERQSSNENLLYLPWELLELPNRQLPDRPDLELSAPMSDLLSEIRSMIRHGTPAHPDMFLRGVPLAHVAHPLLRVFLIPWIHLHEKRSRGIQLQQYEDEAFRAAESIIEELGSCWMVGLQNNVDMKLSKSQQRIHMPWELYWRGTQEDLVRLGYTNLTEASAGLNRLRDLAARGSTQANVDLEALMEFLLYPRLRRLRESVLEPAVGHASAIERGKALYEDWLRCLKPYPILKIMNFNGYLDQDDDPNVVYYRQPLPRATDLSTSKPTASVNIVPDLKLHIRDNQSSLGVFPEEIRSHMSYELTLAVDTYVYFERGTESQSKRHRNVLHWYLNTVVENAELSSKPVIQSQNKYDTVWEPLSFPRTTLATEPTNTPTMIPEPPTTPIMSSTRLQPGVPMTPITPSNALESTLNFISPQVTRTRQLLTPERILSDPSGTPTDNNLSFAEYTYTEPAPLPQVPKPDDSLTLLNDPSSTTTSQDYKPLDVDLNMQAPVLDSLEKELGSVVTNFKRAENGVQWRSRDWTKMESLFKQVMPDDVLDALESRDQATLRLKNSNAMPTSTEEQEFALIRMAASGKQTKWLKSLASSEKLQIRTSSKLIDNGSTPVVFNPRVTKTGPDCRIRVPHRSTSGTSSTPTSPISPGSATQLYYPSAALSNIPRLDSQPVEYQKLLNDVETFNTLLKKWQADPDTMNWEESDRLLSIARAVMPRDLAKLEMELREIDMRARRGALNAAEASMFWDLGDRWQREYAAWLEALRPDITISNESDHESIDHYGVLRLRMDISTYTNLAPVTHTEGLPLVVQVAQNQVKDLLGLGRQFTDSEVQEFESLLSLFWRPYESFIRRHLKSQFLQSPQRMGTRDDDALILINTILAELFIFFQNQIMSLDPEHFYITESTPYEYRIKARTSRSFWETIAQPIFCPSEMTTSRVGLLDKATRLRRNEITTEEINGIEFSQSPAAEADRLAALVRDFQNSQTITRDNAVWDALRAAEEAVFWNRWCRKNPQTILDFQNTLVHPMYDDIVDILCHGLIEVGWSLQLNGPASETEIEVVQIEINNLLRQDEDGTISQTNLSELNYLLRALMPTNLQQLYVRAAASDPEFVIPSRNAQLAVSELFGRYFAEWKRNLPRHGVILDQWWYSTSAIQDLCSRGRRWKAITDYDPNFGSYPATGNDMSSYESREWYRLYGRLITFVENGCVEDDETIDALLLRYMPANTINLPQQIRMLAAPQSPAPDDPDSASKANMLRTLQEHFIQKYMEWITGLEPSVLARFKKEAAAAYAGKIDFTTKAERRGIQRAAIEMALNTLASNQEQHRPNDRFRIVVLPRAHQTLPQAREVPMSLPLEPTKRPLEQNPMEYTKKLLAFKEWKDFDYKLARELQIGDLHNIIDAPSNFNGPFVRQSLETTRIVAQELLTRYTGLSKILHNANQVAPRPLLSRMLERLQSVLARGRNIDMVIEEFRRDTAPLDERALYMLHTLAKPSWDDWAQEFDDDIPRITGIPRERERLIEFDNDVRSFVPETDDNALPFWSMGSETQYQQEEYRPEIPGVRRSLIGLNELVQRINGWRQRQYGASVILWTQDEAHKFLGVMAAHFRIHAEGDRDNAMYARIPLSGHPENRWITYDGELVQRACYKPVGDKYLVKYSHFGEEGPPILQPNLHTYLDRCCYRLGRDIVYLLNLIAHAEDDDPTFHLSHQYRLLQDALTRMSNITAKDRGSAMTAGRDPSSITLKKLALDLHKLAPDLAQEAGYDFSGDPENNMTDAQAGMILQMQVLEEANNAWELKFPEQEHVWNFAEKRLRPREVEYNNRKINVKPKTQQYFSLRRFPVSHQSQVNQDFIKTTGPVIQEKPKSISSPTIGSLDMTGATNLVAAGQQPEKMERHIKNREPHFPFGETPYQALYQDWKMQEMLKGIPEFETPSERPARGLFSRKRRLSPSPPPVDRYALPTIPSSWEPTSVSLADKRLAVIQDLQKLANKDLTLPAPDMLEAWYTPAEVAEIKLREENQIRNDQIRLMVDAVERYHEEIHHDGRTFQDLTREEIRAAQIALDINTFTGMFNRTPMTREQARERALLATSGGRAPPTQPPTQGTTGGGGGRAPPTRPPTQGRTAAAAAAGGGGGGTASAPRHQPRPVTVVEVSDTDSNYDDGIIDVPANSNAGIRPRNNNLPRTPGAMTDYGVPIASGHVDALPEDRTGTGDPTLMSGGLGAPPFPPPPTQTRPGPGGRAGDGAGVVGDNTGTGTGMGGGAGPDGLLGSKTLPDGRRVADV